VEFKNGGHECKADPQSIRSRQREPRVNRECDGSLERKGNGIVEHFRNRCSTIRYGPLVE